MKIRTVFRLWAACLAIVGIVGCDKGGSNKLGPLLFGIMGKKAASMPGYAYSRPMKNFKIVWTDDALRGWLKRPNQTLPGTRMAFAGLSNPKQIEDLIAYMHTLK